MVLEFTSVSIRYEEFMYRSICSRMNSVVDLVQGIWHYLQHSLLLLAQNFRLVECYLTFFLMTVKIKLQDELYQELLVLSTPIGIGLFSFFPLAIHRRSRWSHYCSRKRNDYGGNPVVLQVPVSDARVYEQNQSSVVFCVTVSSFVLRPGLYMGFCHSNYTNSVKARKMSVDTGYCAYAEIAYFNLGSG